MQILDQTRRKAANTTPLVSNIMKPVVTVYSYETMTEATDRLSTADSSSAIAVDGLGQVVGVLTHTDCQNYFALWNRYLNRDETVLREIFETNEFCQLHLDRDYFHQVGKHMTSPVITVPETSSCLDAEQAFRDNPQIHHLVVVDARSKPVGVIIKQDLNH